MMLIGICLSVLVASLATGDDEIKVIKVFETSQNVTEKSEIRNVSNVPKTFDYSKNTNNYLGSSLVTLSYENCQIKECTLGNFVTDAMIFAYAESAPADAWATASIALVDSAVLRSNIRAGDIYRQDVTSAISKDFTIDLADIEGKHLKEMFEYNSTDDNMLQVSGIKIEYNFENEIGSRVQSLKVRCQNCVTPKYETLNEDQTYRLILPSYITKGEGLYDVFGSNLKNIQPGLVPIYDILLDYFEAQSPIFKEEGGRIVVYGRQNEDDKPGGGDDNNNEGDDDDNNNDNGGGGDDNKDNDDDGSKAGKSLAVSIYLYLLIIGLFVCVN